MICYTNKHKIPFQIDDEDEESVSNYNWYIDRVDQGYPSTHIRVYGDGVFNGHTDNRTIRLHEFLMGRAPKGLEWDHKDQNSLNNCRSNLRLATPAMNKRNRRLDYRNTSGCKGVWQTESGRYRARIAVNGKVITLGMFDSYEEAKAARMNAEEMYWGDQR